MSVTTQQLPENRISPHPPGRNSTGAALHPFDVHDHDGAGLEAEPAAGGEIGQGLVDGFAGGTDELGQLLLGEVVVHVYAVVGGAAETVGQVEQGLGDPARNVGEDQVGDRGCLRA